MKPKIGKVVPAPGTGPNPEAERVRGVLLSALQLARKQRDEAIREDIDPDLSRAFADLRAANEREAQLRRELLAAEKQRDEAVGLLKKLNVAFQNAELPGGTSAARIVHDFVERYDQENKQ